MASTNKTTNYELSQFIETDRPAWLTDYNGDMRTIDSIMKAISDVASGASGSISELADRMSTAEGNITTNANDIDALEARADSLEAQAQSTAGTIANIQTEQTAQNLGIEAATELGYNLARPYDSASTYAVGDYVLFQNTLYKCITAIATGEAFDPTKWLAIKATDEIAAGGYTLPIASASQLGGVKVGNNLTIDNNGVLAVPYEYIGYGAQSYLSITNLSASQYATITNTRQNRIMLQILGNLLFATIDLELTLNISSSFSGSIDILGDLITNGINIPANSYTAIGVSGRVQANNAIVGIAFISNNNKITFRTYGDYTPTNPYLDISATFLLPFEYSA